MLCAHCYLDQAGAGDRLCPPCRSDPTLSVLYPAGPLPPPRPRPPRPPERDRYARRGLGLGNRQPPTPETPTAALPGSPEKVEVLRQRVSARQQLHHPADVTLRSARTDEVLRVVARREGRKLYVGGHHGGTGARPRRRVRGEHAVPTATMHEPLPSRRRERL